MSTVILRIVIVATVHLVTFELLLQRSVEWRESTEELALLAQLLLLITGLIWCFLPAFSKHRSQSRRAVVATMFVMLSFVGFHAVTYYYSWHIRPNIGLYEEPRWVSKHPAFQQQLRAKIKNNLWDSET